MTNNFKIESDIAPPGRLCKYPFGEMEIGDSFALDASIYKRVRAAASWYGKRNGCKFSIRKTGDGYRCWRVA